MRSTRGMLAATLFAAGCFSIPPFEPDNGVTFKESAGGGGTVTGVDFELRFADGPAFHFPNALLVNGADVMGHDTAQTCFNENEVGLRIVPSARISATTTAPVVKNELVPVLPGPAAVQVKLDWETRFTCNSARAPGGTSTFTIFPDGRIVRYDVITDPLTMPELAPTPCACEPPTQSEDMLFTFSTHWTFARSVFTDLEFDNMSTAVPPAGTELAANFATTCIKNASSQVAVAWPLAMAPQGMGLNTAVRGRASLIDFRRDLEIGITNLGKIDYENSSAIFIEHGGCAAAFKRADEHAMPPDLMVNGTATPLSTRDGIYGGDRGPNGVPGIEADRFELRGTLNSSFAVWLRFPRSVEAIRATLPNPTSGGYLPQRVDDRSWIVWFKQGLSSTQTITVEPR